MLRKKYLVSALSAAIAIPAIAQNYVVVVDSNDVIMTLVVFLIPLNTVNGHFLMKPIVLLIKIQKSFIMAFHSKRQKLVTMLKKEQKQRLEHTIMEQKKLLQ